MRQGVKKVDFVVAGAQKSGTTSLDLYLRDHPSIHMPNSGRKELHFFDIDENYKKGLGHYHNNFDTDKKHLLWGEVTPIYMYWSSVAARLKIYNPDMKIILILRNPVERAYSHWNMEVRKGLEILSFEAAIDNEVQCKSRNGDNYQHRVISYIDRGYYTFQIKRLLKYFPSDQLLILNYSDLRSCPRQVMQRISSFLKVPYIDFIKVQKANIGSYKCPMNETVKQFLYKKYEQEILELELLLGWDCQGWLKQGNDR